MMKDMNIHEDKTFLSLLCIAQAVNTEHSITAQSGKPSVKVGRLDAPESGQMSHLGFMSGQISVPDDFDLMGGIEMEHLFEVAE
jgi:hypothetical protein